MELLLTRHCRGDADIVKQKQNGVAPLALMIQTVLIMDGSVIQLHNDDASPPMWWIYTIIKMNSTFLKFMFTLF